MKILDMHIDVRPLPKERPRLGKYGNTYTPSKTKTYEELIGLKAKEQIKNPTLKKCSVFIVFGFKKKTKADIDNLAKAVLDGMNGIVYKDDNQIEWLTVVKYENQKNDGVRITVHEE